MSNLRVLLQFPKGSIVSDQRVPLQVLSWHVSKIDVNTGQLQGIVIPQAWQISWRSLGRVMRAISVHHVSLKSGSLAKESSPKSVVQCNPQLQVIATTWKKENRAVISPNAPTYQKLRFPNPTHILQSIFKNRLVDNTRNRYTSELSCTQPIWRTNRRQQY